MKSSSMKYIAVIIAAMSLLPLNVLAQGPEDVIPVPFSYETHDGVYKLPECKSVYVKCSQNQRLSVSHGAEDYCEIHFMDFLSSQGYGRVERAGDAAIRFYIGDRYMRHTETDCEGDEAYVIEVDKKGVKVQAATFKGAYNAFQTIQQMLQSGGDGSLRCCRIEDFPRFPYRGVHMDVSRHFRTKEFILKHIDAMAAFKMNKLHLHLTDAAGWRLQIDAYPRLTDFAAWRDGTTWKEWVSKGYKYLEQGTEGAYGGYYTKDDIREIVAYARLRNIEVIPEIEMPSHSEEVLAAYPELGCSGEPYKNSDFCVGKEGVFTFLETVLAEVMDLFPSDYIHIGGDEASKKFWKTCPDCQSRMKQEGLETVDELQSYMISRIEKFINSKGRRIIGWDEILQGGLAPNATVMSWRGTEGGIKAMSQGHDVIMSPGRYCYLDHTQDAPFMEPESIGGYLPLDSVYVYDPMPSVSELADVKSLSHHLLGVQANLWSEYVVTDEHCEYMYWPRAIAVAESAWSQPEKKDIKSFRRRVLPILDFMKEKGYEVFDLRNEYGERKLAQTGLAHKAVGKKVTYNIPYHQSYPAAGETTLTDGIIGGWTYSDHRWQGTLRNVDVTVDMGEIIRITYIGATFMQLAGPGVFMPEKVDISVSADGVEFTPVAEVWNEVSPYDSNLLFKKFDTICDVEARYIRYQAKRSIRRGWLFVDEIVIN